MPYKSIALLASALAALVALCMFGYSLWGSSVTRASAAAPGIYPDLPGQVTAMPSRMPGKVDPGQFILRASRTPGAIESAVSPGTPIYIITLDLPSAAEVGATLRKSSIPENIVDALVQVEVARLKALQERLIAQLTAPEIAATFVGQTQLTSNMLFIQVDASKLDLIRALPGVASVTMSKPMRQNLPSTGPIKEPPSTNGAGQDK